MREIVINVQRGEGKRRRKKGGGEKSLGWQRLVHGEDSEMTGKVQWVLEKIYYRSPKPCITEGALNLF